MRIALSASKEDSARAAALALSAAAHLGVMARLDPELLLAGFDDVWRTAVETIVAVKEPAS